MKYWRVGTMILCISCNESKEPDPAVHSPDRPSVEELLKGNPTVERSAFSRERESVLRAKRYVQEGKADLARVPLGELCDQGRGYACSMLGALVDEGGPLTYDPGLAATHYERGCEKNSPAACMSLARILETGSGVTENKPRAVELREKATVLEAKKCSEGRSCDPTGGSAPN